MTHAEGALGKAADLRYNYKPISLCEIQRVNHASEQDNKPQELLLTIGWIFKAQSRNFSLCERTINRAGKQR